MFTMHDVLWCIYIYICVCVCVCLLYAALSSPISWKFPCIFLRRWVENRQPHLAAVRQMAALQPQPLPAVFCLQPIPNEQSRTLSCSIAVVVVGTVNVLSTASKRFVIYNDLYNKLPQKKLLEAPGIATRSKDATGLTLLLGTRSY